MPSPDDTPDFRAASLRHADRVAAYASALGAQTGVVQMLGQLERSLECAVWLQSPAVVLAASSLSESAADEYRDAARAGDREDDDAGVTVVHLPGAGPGAPPTELACACTRELLGESGEALLDECSAFLQRHRALVAEQRVRRRAAGREFVERADSGEISPPELDAWGRALGIGRPGHLVAVVLQLSGARAADLDDAASALEDLCDAAAAEHVVVVRDGEVCGLVRATGDEPAALRAVERYQELARPRMDRLGGAVGTSSAISSHISDAIRLLHDARRVCQVNLLTAPARPVVPTPAADVPLVLQLLGDRRDELQTLRSLMLEPLYDYDVRHGSELVRTLDVFLGSGGQWNVSARALDVHVNTLRYRIARIEKCTGRDLASTADRVDFYLALRFEELIAGEAEHPAPAPVRAAPPR